MKKIAGGLAACALLAIAVGCKDGEGVIVRHLKFDGVKQVSEEELRLALTTSGTSRIPFSDKTYFSKQDFTEDLKRLESFYASHGFAEARVVSYKTNYNKDKSEMDLTVVVREGEPTVVESVEFTGFDVLPAGHLDGLRSRMGITVEKPRDQERVEAVRGMALDELRDHGYPAAKVAIDERAGSGAHRVIVAYSATPGTFSKFGEVIIHGNSTVSAAFIRRQLAFHRGTTFSLSDVQQSQRRLAGLELFQFANVEVGDTPKTPDEDKAPINSPKPVNNAGAQSTEATDKIAAETQATGEVPISITVVEAPHRQLTFGLGYGSEEHARVQATFKHLNFLGDARTATLETRYSSLERGVRVSFSDPSIGRGLSLGASGQTWFASTPAYSLRTTGGRLGVLKSLTGRNESFGGKARSSVSLSFAREFESYQVSDAALADLSFRPTLIALGLNPLTGEGSGTTTAVTIDAQSNRVANPIDAHSGTLFTLHLENAAKILGGDFAYREASGEARVYLPVGPSITIAAHGRAGTIGGGSDPNTSVPFFKRYFLGGANSLRGWGRFEVAPLTADGLPIGGFTMLETSGELRLTNGATGNFGVVGFIDAGNVWDRSLRFYLNDLRTDIGVGVRYKTPIGPLRLDFGYQLTPISGLVIDGRAPGDFRRWRIHFSIGQAF